jgi:hypothetical protein
MVNAPQRLRTAPPPTLGEPQNEIDEVGAVGRTVRSFGRLRSSRICLELIPMKYQIKAITASRYMTVRRGSWSTERSRKRTLKNNPSAFACMACLCKRLTSHFMLSEEELCSGLGRPGRFLLFLSLRISRHRG